MVLFGEGAFGRHNSATIDLIIDDRMEGLRLFVMRVRKLQSRYLVDQIAQLIAGEIRVMPADGDQTLG